MWSVTVWEGSRSWDRECAILDLCFERTIDRIELLYDQMSGRDCVSLRLMSCLGGKESDEIR